VSAPPIGKSSLGMVYEPAVWIPNLGRRKLQTNFARRSGQVLATQGPPMCRVPLVHGGTEGDPEDWVWTRVSSFVLEPLEVELHRSRSHMSHVQSSL
jgi:hypothetical protein